MCAVAVWRRLALTLTVAGDARLGGTFRHLCGVYFIVVTGTSHAQAWGCECVGVGVGDLCKGPQPFLEVWRGVVSGVCLGTKEMDDVFARPQMLTQFLDNGHRWVRPALESTWVRCWGVNVCC